MDDDVEVITGTKDVLADVSGRVGLAAAMMTPSTRVCGEAIMSGMSLQVPGSDSSPLTTR